MRWALLSIFCLFILAASYFSFSSTIIKPRDFLDYGLKDFPQTIQTIASTYWSMAFLKYDRKKNFTYVGTKSPTYTVPFDSDEAAYQARLHWYNGDFEKAIDVIERKYLAKGERREELLYWLANSYARLGEEKNCLSHLVDEGHHVHHLHYEGPRADNSKDMNSMCALPLIMVHDKKQYSEKAIEIFKELARRFPKRKRLYTWLINFYSLTTGVTMDKVDTKYKIKSDFVDFYSEENKIRLERKYSWLKLENKAKQLGIDTLNAGKGTAVEDFDGDGDLDIILAGSYSPMKYYANTGGAFEDRSTESGLETIASPFLISTVDVNGDGHFDLFISRWFFPNQLLINNGRGQFTNQTSEWHLPTGSNQTLPWIPSWADYDNDGDLDLFVAAFATRLPLVKTHIPSRLYRNEGDHFKDISHEVGLDELNSLNLIKAAWGDVNGDGFVDLFLSSANSRGSLLFKNIKGRTFEPVPLPQSKSGFAATFLDYDHDGDLDILSPATIFSVDMAVRQTVFADGNNDSSGLGQTWIYENLGDFRFEVKRPFPQHGTQATMGASFGDINGDGCLDYYFGTGSPEETYILPNLFFLGQSDGNRCSTEFENLSPVQGLGSIQKGHGIVFFDFDEDGDQDIYSSLGGFWPADKWPNQFFVNQSQTDHNWIKVRLRGKRSNLHGLGAHIRINAITADEKPLIRYYYMNSKTGFGSAPLLAHIGLATATQVESIEVKWPGQTKWTRYFGTINTLNILEERL